MGAGIRSRYPLESSSTQGLVPPVDSAATALMMARGMGEVTAYRAAFAASGLVAAMGLLMMAALVIHINRTR